jgi:hypothetical protein
MHFVRTCSASWRKPRKGPSAAPGRRRSRFIAGTCQSCPSAARARNSSGEECLSHLVRRGTSALEQRRPDLEPDGVRSATEVLRVVAGHGALAGFQRVVDRVILPLMDSVVLFCCRVEGGGRVPHERINALAEVVGEGDLLLRDLRHHIRRAVGPLQRHARGRLEE